MGGVAEVTSAREDGHNSICVLTVCHYTLYLHETHKPGVAGHDAEHRGMKVLCCVSNRTTGDGYRAAWPVMRPLVIV